MIHSKSLVLKLLTKVDCNMLWLSMLWFSKQDLKLYDGVLSDNDATLYYLSRSSDDMKIYSDALWASVLTLSIF